MPECPTCLRPAATEADEALWRALDKRAPLPEGWPDENGSHLCWRVTLGFQDQGCVEPAWFTEWHATITPAEIRDLRARLAALESALSANHSPTK